MSLNWIVPNPSCFCGAFRGHSPAKLVALDASVDYTVQIREAGKHVTFGKFGAIATNVPVTSATCYPQLPWIYIHLCSEFCGRKEQREATNRYKILAWCAEKI